MSSDERTERINKFDGFANSIGIVVTQAADGCAEGEIILEKRHFNPIGSVHGGCLFSLADTVAGVALASTDVVCTTLSSHVEFLNGAMKGRSHKLIAKAAPVRIGGRIAVYNVEITDDTGVDIARLTAEFYIMSSKHKFDI